MKQIHFILCILLAATSNYSSAQNLMYQAQASQVVASLINNVNTSYQIVHQQATPYTEHYTYVQTVYGLPVFGSKLYINFNKKTGQYNISDCRKHFQIIPQDASRQNNSNAELWYVHNNQLVACTTTRKTACGTDSFFIARLDGTILLATDMAQHYLKDTTIRARIFLPDPLTSSGNVYGGTYIDNNDANAPWLEAQQILVSMPARYDTANKVFILENKYAFITEANLPTVAPVTQSNPDFFYTRDQSGFEDCNALYHVTAFRKYIDSLGFNNILPMKVRIDAHGNLGSDNSTFYRGSVPFLDMGTGGVDDAEDADVIIHELGHGISWSANDNFIASNERDALDEGLCDYFAASYSKRANTFKWQDVFSWDGHNEFWGGRTVQTELMYAQAQSQDIYTLGSVFSTAMMEIWDSLGPYETDKLMLQSLFYYTDTSNLRAAAKYLLDADDVINGGIHRDIICAAFKRKGIDPISGCDSINPGNKPSIYNSKAFALNNGPLQVRGLGNNAQVYVINTAGQVIFSQEANNVLIIPSDAIALRGVYILQVVTSDKKISNFKIIKSAY